LIQKEGVAGETSMEGRGGSVANRNPGGIPQKKRKLLESDRRKMIPSNPGRNQLIKEHRDASKKALK